MQRSVSIVVALLLLTMSAGAMSAQRALSWVYAGKSYVAKFDFGYSGPTTLPLSSNDLDLYQTVEMTEADGTAFSVQVRYYCGYGTARNSRNFYISGVRLEATPSDVVKQFGDITVDGRTFQDVIYTLAGNPTTLVWNDTDLDINFNNDGTIPSGGTGVFQNTLNFSLYKASTGSLPDDVTFFDRDTGAAIGSNRLIDHYYPFYTGNLRIHRDYATTNGTVATRLTPLYSGSTSNLVYGREGGLIYGRYVCTNFDLKCEWAFDEEPQPPPVAYINGKSVCDSHSTTHIISYNVVAEKKKSDSEDRIEIPFTMSISGLSGSCTFRVFDGTSFGASAESHRASVDGSTTASFKVVLDAGDMTWTVTSE